MVRETEVCIVGAGPAGMLLALCLAKLGVKVLVLEQHKDFEREYRGEVLMPRFVQAMQQIGLFEELERCEHLKIHGVEGYYGERRLVRIGLDEISPQSPFALWMPQPVLLYFLHKKAAAFPQYEILFDSCVKSLIEEDGKVKGVTAVSERGDSIEVRAKITVGADGRFSILRRHGGFEVEEDDYHFDIVWFSVPRPQAYDPQVRFYLNSENNFLILPKYPDLLQCGLIVPRGDFSKIRHDGIESLKKRLRRAHPLFESFAERLRDFSPFRVLQARIEYVRKWARDGALLVGDSAHTCSPAGAIGVSVAAASALTAADVIFRALAEKNYSQKALSKLQEIRQDEVREIQRVQKKFTRLLLAETQAAQWFLPAALFLAARLGFLKAAQRKLLAAEKPLSLSARLRF